VSNYYWSVLKESVKMCDPSISYSTFTENY